LWPFSKSKADLEKVGGPVAFWFRRLVGPHNFVVL
jgi:hypothetical protein